MFIAPCIAPEEVVTEKRVGQDKRGVEITQKVIPRMLNSPQGIYFKEVALKSSIDLNSEAYYTTIIKYLPENLNHRTKPLKTMMDEAWPYLEAEIEAVKPEVIACVGKLVFDQFVPFRAKESDVRGGWFYSERYKAKLFLVPHISQVLKADKHEAFSLAFDGIRKMLDETSGVEVEKVPIRGRVIRDSEELKAWVEEMISEEVHYFSVDCEWGGSQHVDGRLRSLQIAWSESDAIYIRFRDEEEKYAFDVGYKEAGAILSRVLDHEDSYYLGHQISADLPWMHRWLGLKWYNKAIFDTEFAEQCCNEAAGLGLDDLALRYTDFGKYDWELIEWKKAHPDKCTDGYGFIPDRILIPYGWKDVLTVYRAWKVIRKKLKAQDLEKYYDEILNPLVTNVTTFFCLKGLPIDRGKIDEMRDLYNWAKRELMIDFQRAITMEADTILRTRLKEMGAEGVYDAVEELLFTGQIGKAEEELKRAVGAAKWPELMPVWEHAVNAPHFNDRSKPQMMRWLFQVKGYKPIKSTPNREKGMPAIDWKKVETFPPNTRGQYTPATDVQTLETLAAMHNDETIRQLLMFNAVGNICKSFLKPAEKDDDGKVVKEEGLHYWITSDDRICLNHATTETGNILIDKAA